MEKHITRIVSYMLAFAAAAAFYTSNALAAGQFTDVDGPYAAAIEFCVEREFVRGTSETTFDPDAPLTREQFAMIWGRTLRLRPPHSFEDVLPYNAHHEADNAIIIMYALRQFNGFSDTHFGKYEPMTREQAATLFMRTYLLGVDGDDRYTHWDDAETISDYARNPVSACMEFGLFNGIITGDEFRPHQALTRGEFCQMLYNLMYDEVEEELDNSGEGEGYGEGEGEGYGEGEGHGEGEGEGYGEGEGTPGEGEGTPGEGEGTPGESEGIPGEGEGYGEGEGTPGEGEGEGNGY